MNKPASARNTPFSRARTFGVACVTVLIFATACRSSSQKAPVPITPTATTSTPSTTKWNLKDCGISVEDAAGLSHNMDTDVYANAEVAETIQHMVTAKDFGQLDCLAEHYRSSKERFSGGVWKLYLLYSALSQPVPFPQHPTEEDWHGHISLLDDWRAANPKSLTARVAEASTYIDYAWTARGEGYSDSVTNSGWKLFEERIARAADLLHDDSTVPAKDAQWYFTMLQIATTGQTWELEKAHALFEDAYRFEPRYFYYGRQFRYYLEPKWAGEEGDSEKFSTDIADRVGGDEGDAYYYRLAVDGICDCQDSPKFDWPRMVKGFKASEKLYGPSLVDMNEIAYLASHSFIDPVVANEVMPAIGDQWNKYKWDSEKTFQETRDWAARVGPLTLKARQASSEAAANEKTAEGMAYKLVFEKEYKRLAEECMKAEGAKPEKFETDTQVGATGTVEDMKVFGTGSASRCIYYKLQAAKDSRTILFPKPPHGSYWVKVDIDLGEFSTAASR